MMKRLGLIGAVVVAATAASPAHCDVIKVGVIGTMSGPFALFGQNFKEGIDTWVAEHASKVGDHQIEFIYRDEESPNPAKSKALAHVKLDWNCRPFEKRFSPRTCSELNLTLPSSLKYLIDCVQPYEL